MTISTRTAGVRSQRARTFLARLAWVVAVLVFFLVDYPKFQPLTLVTLSGCSAALVLGAALGLARRRLAVAAAVLAAWLLFAARLDAHVALLPRDGMLPLAYVVTKGALVVAVLPGARTGEEEASADPRAVAIVPLLAVALIALARVQLLVANATSIHEQGWSEAPILTNILKLDAHETLYGPVDQLNSYIYSPLLELTHRFVLGVANLELSLHANRALTIGEQGLGAALILFGLWPYVRPALPSMLGRHGVVWLVLAVFAATYANMLAGVVHPDHPGLVCIGVAITLVLRRSSWPRWGFWSALLLVTPVATAFKLSGAGIGVGLFLVFLIERDFRALGVLVLSAALAIATVPLFEHTLGRFMYYAIDIQLSHPREWTRGARAPFVQFAAAALFAFAAAALLGGQGRRGDDGALALRRVALLFFGVALLPVVAYFRFAAQENNLATVVLGSVVVLIVASARATGAKGSRHPILGPLLIAHVMALTRFGAGASTPSDVSTSSEASREWPSEAEDQSAVVSVIRSDDARGERTLPLTAMAWWIAAGRRDVPRDRLQSAYELFFSGRTAEANVFFDHLGDGRYRTIVVSNGGDLARTPDLRGAFVARMRTTIEDHYELTYPPRVSDPTKVPGALIYRHRDSSRVSLEAQ